MTRAVERVGKRWVVTAELSAGRPDYGRVTIVRRDMVFSAEATAYLFPVGWRCNMDGMAVPGSVKAAARRVLCQLDRTPGFRHMIGQARVMGLAASSIQSGVV